MRGSVVKRAKTWSYVVDVGRDAVTGRRRQRWKGGFATRRDAEQALTKALGALDSGAPIEPSALTVGVFLEQWLTGHVPSLKPSTAKSYRAAVRWYAGPRIGRINLIEASALRPREPAHFLASATTARSPLVMLHTSKVGRLDRGRDNQQTARDALGIEETRLPHNEHPRISPSRAPCRREVVTPRRCRWDPCRFRRVAGRWIRLVRFGRRDGTSGCGLASGVSKRSSIVCSEGGRLGSGSS